jgi:hypothetical protein
VHDLLRCRCSRINDPWRRFCGGCGSALAPCCTECGFVNGRSDRYCGGCGSNISLLMSEPIAAARTATVRGRPQRPPTSERTEPHTMPIEILDEVQ